MYIFKKIALGSASVAMILTPAAPIMAADMGTTDHAPLSAYDGAASYDDDASSYHRRGRYHRHRDRVDAGDVIAGIGILAGIAILADAASKSKKRDRDDRNYPQDYPRGYPQNYPQDNRQNFPQNGTEGGYGSGNDIGDAVEACSVAAESRAGGNAQVEQISSVTRDGDGWRVEGDLSGARVSSFSCGVTGGQVDFIQFND
ncbi:hypothetical protein ACFOWX_01340 [Sphingorhabdus arenilitoris]|uniref:Secreted protein n=1 Tax=Sphingorhabdus arenilitoris TaxID=1490041 RepID=A0ABV8RDN6_9SPHN